MLSGVALFCAKIASLYVAENNSLLFCMLLTPIFIPEETVSDNSVLIVLISSFISSNLRGDGVVKSAIILFEFTKLKKHL